MWHGKFGGRGLSTRSSVCQVSIGSFGGAIVGSIGIDTESLAIAPYLNQPALGAFRKRVLEDLQGTGKLPDKRVGRDSCGGHYTHDLVNECNGDFATAVAGACPNW